MSKDEDDTKMLRNETTEKIENLEKELGMTPNS